MKKRITLIVFSVLIIVALYVLYCFNYIPHKKYTNADFNIEAPFTNIRMIFFLFMRGAKERR